MIAANRPSRAAAAFMVAVDPALRLTEALSLQLPSSMRLTEQIARDTDASVAIVGIDSASHLLAGAPAHRAHIVVLHHYHQETVSRLYRGGADVVLINPSIEELAARVRAMARLFDATDPLAPRATT
jgi:hypothetical protein